MGWMVSSAIKVLYGERAANSVSTFADQYAGDNTYGFINRFKKIAEAARPKFIWAKMSDVNSQVKANMVAVLGAQFKSPEHKHMPQSASLSILQSLDGFCIAGAPKKDVATFLSYWESAANPKKTFSNQDICAFANTVRRLRKLLESYVLKHPDAHDIAKCKMLQTHLCYIEAGFYRVSQIDLIDEMYYEGPRISPERMNPLIQGYFDFEQPTPGVRESRDDNTTRELKHDILISGLFAMEAASFEDLGCHPLGDFKQLPIQSTEEFLNKGIIDSGHKRRSQYTTAVDVAHTRLRQLNQQYLGDYVSPISRVESDQAFSSPGMFSDPSNNPSQSSSIPEHSDASVDKSNAVMNAESVSNAASSIQDEMIEEHDSVSVNEEHEIPVKPTGRRTAWLSNARSNILAFLRSLRRSSDHVAVVPEEVLMASIDQGIDDEVEAIEQGIDRVLNHSSLQSGVSRPDASVDDLRRSLKTRLQHYLYLEQRLLDAQPDLDSSTLLRLGVLNHRAEDTLDAFKRTSRSPKWNALKKVWGGYSHQGKIRNQLNDLCKKVHDCQRLSIETAFRDKLDAAQDELSEGLSWLKHDYGLDRCTDERHLDAFLHHLEAIDGSLSINEMKAYCRGYDLLLADQKGAKPS